MNWELWLTDLGFTKQDVRLLLLCPLFSMIGGLAHSMMLHSDFSRIPKTSPKILSVSVAINRLGWLGSRLVLSGIIGVMLSLYFIGAFTDNPTTVGRVLGFSIVLGYAGPKLWTAQERIVDDIIEQKMRGILEAELDVKGAANSQSKPLKGK